MDMKNTLRALCEAFGPTGRETRVAGIIEDMVKDYADEIRHDALGNLIAIRHGKGKRIMLAAHMDQIGFIVTGVDENGFLRIHPLGGIARNVTLGRKVVFENGVEGVIGAEEESFKDKPAISKLYVDLGAADKKEAEKIVSIGDTASFVGGFVKCGDNVVSKTLDNRVGCTILMQALSEIKDCENDLYFVFTTQEEVGLRGAKTAAFAINPDIAVAVDVTDTGDTPSAPTMAIELGKGTAIKVMDRSIMCDADVRTMMIETAKKNKIPYQLEIMTDGGTDAGAIHLTRAGIKTGGISVPTRYVHSPSEMASISDIENSVKLLYNIAIAQW